MVKKNILTLPLKYFVIFFLDEYYIDLPMRLLEMPNRNYAKHPCYVYEGESTKEFAAAIRHLTNRKPFYEVYDFVSYFPILTVAS